MKKLASIFAATLMLGCAARYTSTEQAWVADDHCYTTVQGIEVHAYKTECPAQQRVEDLTFDLYSRVGAWPNILSGTRVTFTPKALTNCAGSVSGPVKGKPGVELQVRGCAGHSTAVVYKRSDWPDTYLHELGHLMLARQGLSDPLDTEGSVLELLITSRNFDFYLLRHTPWDGIFQSRKPL